MFRAAYVSGAYIPRPDAVTAMAVLFERVYLPANLELIRAFAKRFRFSGVDEPQNSVESASRHPDLGLPRQDFFADLEGSAKTTANRYLHTAIDFSLAYSPLLDGVFETDLFDSKPSVWVKGESTAVVVRIVDSGDRLSERIREGYVPVVGEFDPGYWRGADLDRPTAEQLATLLAMKSIELVLPRFKGAHPETILEARYRLSDHLPPFWSAMLKLTIELRSRIKDSSSSAEVVREAGELVQTIVRPSLIDLQEKLKHDRRDWFYRVLSPLHKGLRLLAGAPPLTPPQLASAAILLASDVASSTAESLRLIDRFKRESGLTFLMEFGAISEQ
jgi:hypothetical protein